jgi:hydroxymethylpyrimidine kinase/phosphomethylpyrimidine kinase
MKTYKTVLSIAGSDSIGGAGVQADIKSCCAHGVYAMTVITALTAQNTCGVMQVEPTSPDMLRAQLDAVFQDVLPHAVKVGMIPNGKSLRIIAEVLRKYSVHSVVVDPLMVSTSGHRLSDDDYPTLLREHLIPLSTLLTPNLPEAARLTGVLAHTPDEMRALAQQMSYDYDIAVLLKGGHLPQTDVLTDVLAMPDGTIEEISHPYISTTNTHGTGCSLSSAIAALLAKGTPLEEAVRTAVHWLSKAIEAGAEYRLGSGHGPIYHLYNSIKL